MFPMNRWKRQPLEQRTVHIAIRDGDRITLFPLDIRRDGNEFLIGRRDCKTYVAVPEVAVRIISMMNANCTIGEVRRRLQTDYDNVDDALDGFVLALLNSGFVASIGSEAVAADSKTRIPRKTGIKRQHVAWLFSRTMMTAYALVILAGAAVFVLEPGIVPKPLAVLSAYPYWLFAILSLVTGIINVTKHEAAHVLAAASLGIRADLSIGHRMCFPVIQTDLTSLWAVPRKDRYIAYSAGIVSDLVTLSFIIITFWLNARGIVPFGETFVLLLTIALLVVTSTVAWQFNFFMKTDVYYILASALGCRNLQADAVQYLRHLLRRSIRQPSANPLDRIPLKEARAVRFFSAILAAGTSALIAGAFAYLYFVMDRHRVFGPADKAVLFFIFALTAGSVIFSVRRNRKPPKATYRLSAEARS